MDGEKHVTITLHQEDIERIVRYLDSEEEIIDDILMEICDQGTKP